jgi:hypothetical protein
MQRQPRSAEQVRNIIEAAITASPTQSPTQGFERATPQPPAFANGMDRGLAAADAFGPAPGGDGRGGSAAPSGGSMVRTPSGGYSFAWPGWTV